MPTLPSLLDPANYAARDAPLPLGDHVFIDTHDPRRARELTSKVFAPHRLKVSAPAAFHASNHHVRLNRLSLYAIRYRPAVEISSAPMRHYYLLLAPVRGTCQIHYGASEWTATSGSLSILNPFEPIRLGWGDDCIQLVIKIDRHALDSNLEALRGGPPFAPVAFTDGAAVPYANCPGVVRMIEMLFEDQNRAEPTMSHGNSEAAAESLFLDILLREFPGSQDTKPVGAESRIAPHYVKRVEEFLRLHAMDRITISDMVSVSGVSERTLYHGFQTFRRVGPRAYLKRIRLEYVRTELAAAAVAEHRVTVTEIASRWGFNHAGNFGQDYKAQFGETPSQTLRKKGPAGILQPSR